MNLTSVSSLPSMRRLITSPLVGSLLAGLALLQPGITHAQTAIRFQLDWRFEGPSALFLAAQAKGYFKEEKLDVTIDPGNGSGNAVNRVAAGTYDMGFADLAALMEFWGNNANVPTRPVAVMMVYNNTPAAIFALKKSKITKPSDLHGKRLGAPVFDAGRRAFPIFAAANSLDEKQISWTSMDPPLRETMLVRGDVDAITTFTFTSLMGLNARGVKDEDIVILPYPQYGVKIYSNAVIASPKLIKENPEAVKAFLRALTKGIRDVIADPDAAVKMVKARDPIIDEALERKRLKLAIKGSIVTADAKAEGFGDVNDARLALMAAQVTDAFKLKERIDPKAVFTAEFLPPKAQRNILK